jgi:CRISPR-associated endoribonuclease Cas6
MRFEVSYKLSNNLLPIEYRRGFASLIKEALRKANTQLFEKYYSKLHVLKPFTFSVYFPGLAGREGDHFKVGQNAFLKFSTPSYELGTYVYNGLRELRTFPLFESTLTLEQVSLKPMITITEETALFKTMAPVLVNNKGDANSYLLPGEAGFNEGLDFAVKEVSRVFLCDDGVSIQFKPIQIRRKVVRHYNMNMQGLVGVFELRGRPDVLNLIYQIGLGVRRSQGFGMLEVVQTTSCGK